MIKKYIDENKKLPHDKDPDIHIRSMRSWIRQQVNTYLNKTININESWFQKK